jgi:hypothetical protein
MGRLQPHHKVFKFHQSNPPWLKTCLCKFRFEVGFATTPEPKDYVILLEISNSISNVLQFPKEVKCG